MRRLARGVAIGAGRLSLTGVGGPLVRRRLAATVAAPALLRPRVAGGLARLCRQPILIATPRLTALGIGRLGAARDRDVQLVGAGRGNGPDASGRHQLALAAVRGGDLNPALLDRDRGCLGVDGDGEHRPLDQSDEVGRAYAEMGRVLLLDPEDGTAVILDHLNDAARVARLGKAQPRGGRHNDVVLAPHEHGARAGRGLDDVARAQLGPTLDRSQ
jgi:hypothetical protein